MWWKNSSIAKVTSSVGSVMLSVFGMLALVWLTAMVIVTDPMWRWSIAVIGTIVCLGSPGGLVSIFWLSSSDYRKQWKAYRRGGLRPGYPTDEPWQGSSAKRILEKYTDDFVSTKTILGSHSEEFQSDLKQEMHATVSDILRAENSLLKCREKLAAYVVEYADWMVLGLKREEKPDLKKQLGAMSYVSGELHRHIRYCSQYNSDLARVIQQNKDATDDMLVSWANARSCASLYVMNCINVVRADVGDFPSGHQRDWFQPFVQSMLIWKEDEYRNKIGLPTILPDGLAACHSTFLTCVLEGVRDPLSYWETAYGLKHGDVS